MLSLVNCIYNKSSAKINYRWCGVLVHNGFCVSPAATDLMQKLRDFLPAID